MRKNGGIFKNKVEEDIEMKIYHAQVNHLENPMGFRMERTVFSWKVKDAEGKKQSYARIRVASDAAMEHLLFDSGEDDKASSLFYPVLLTVTGNPFSCPCFIPFSGLKKLYFTHRRLPGITARFHVPVIPRSRLQIQLHRIEKR